MDVDLTKYCDEEKVILVQLWKASLKKANKKESEYPLSAFIARKENKNSIEASPFSLSSTNTPTRLSSSPSLDAKDYSSFGATGSDKLKQTIGLNSFVKVKNSLVPTKSSSPFIENKEPNVWTIHSLANKKLSSCENPQEYSSSDKVATPLLSEKMSSLSVEEWQPKEATVDLMSLSSKSKTKNVSSSPSEDDNVKTFLANMLGHVKNDKTLTVYKKTPNLVLLHMAQFWAHYFRNKEEAARLYKDINVVEVSKLESSAKMYLSRLSVPVLSHKDISALSTEQRQKLAANVQIPESFEKIANTVVKDILS